MEIVTIDNFRFIKKQASDGFGCHSIHLKAPIDDEDPITQAKIVFNLEDEKTKELYLADINVEKEYKGLGLGDYLLNQLYKFCEKHKIRRIHGVLVSYERDPDFTRTEKIIKWYLDRGFSVHRGYREDQLGYLGTIEKIFEPVGGGNAYRCAVVAPHL